MQKIITPSHFTQFQFHPPSEIANFLARVRSVLGFAPPDIVPGKPIRFATSDRRGDKSGWAIIFDDGKGGIFGCWRSGVTQTWRARQLSTEMERRTFAEHIRKAQEEVGRFKVERSAECRRESARLWGIGRDISRRHPYVVAKGIIPCGARQLRDSLLIPVRGHDGTLRGLQFIGPDGRKKFKSGTEIAGGYCSIGTLNNKILLVCEGWATGCTLHEATGHAVAVSFSAGNLRPVCNALRDKYYDWTLIVCADDDQLTSGNPGLTKATDAARAVNGMLAIPDFSGIDRSESYTDFNDMAKSKGMAEIVRVVGKVSYV